MYRYLLILFGTYSLAAVPYKAVVTVPVADLSYRSVWALCKKPDACYQLFPLSPDKGTAGSLRVHQLLYNQIVTVQKELPTGEVIIHVPSFYFRIQEVKKKKKVTSDKKSDCWMLKRNLMPLSHVHKTLHNSIPPAIDYKKKHTEYNLNVLTLTRPWNDSVARRTYSVGTRFVRCHEQDTQDRYGAWLIDYADRSARCVTIPRDHATVTYYKTFERARRVFMALLRSWAHEKQGIVPYVFGGCSYTVPFKDTGFERVDKRLYGLKTSYWKRQEGHYPLCGFDCSSSILCAAQIAGLPYFCKNTHALLVDLKDIKQGEPIEEGDLVWHRGHVLVVNDLKKNTLIEAAGYDLGYGRMHEIHVSNVFSGIKTLQELRQAYVRRSYQKKPFMYRLNSSGKRWRRIYTFRILKLRSSTIA